MGGRPNSSKQIEGDIVQYIHCYKVLGIFLKLRRPSHKIFDAFINVLQYDYCQVIFVSFIASLFQAYLTKHRTNYLIIPFLCKDKESNGKRKYYEN